MFLESKRGGIFLERHLLPARDGLVALRQRFTGDGLRVVVTHGASVIALVSVERGELSFPLASGEYKAPERFWMTLPPRSVLPMRFRGALVHSEGVAGFFDSIHSAPGLFA